MLRIFRTQRPLVQPSPHINCTSRDSRPVAHLIIRAITSQDHHLFSQFTPSSSSRPSAVAVAAAGCRAAGSYPTFSPHSYYDAHHSMSTSTASPASASTKVEEAKELAAKKAVAEHFSVDFKFVGIGSGTTIVYVINEIRRVLGKDRGKQLFVPTGYQSREEIVRAGLTPIAFDTLPEDVVLDVAFDGADEVDEDLNCIKGGGACLFQEKLVAERARKFVCVAGKYPIALSCRTMSATSLSICPQITESSSLAF
jgi:hypothetical protein